MKNSTKTSRNSNQYIITLKSHSTANPIATVNALRVEWNTLNEHPDPKNANDPRYDLGSHLRNLIGKNIWKYAKRYGYNLYSNGREPDDYINAVWDDMYCRLSEPVSMVNSIPNGVLTVSLLRPMWESIDVVFKRTNRASEYYKEKRAAKKKAKDTPKKTPDGVTSWTRTITMKQNNLPLEAVPESVDRIEQVTMSIAIRQVFNTFSEVEKEIAILKAEGMTDETIGKKVGLKRGMVNYYLRKMRDAFRDADLHD